MRPWQEVAEAGLCSDSARGVTTGPAAVPAVPAAPPACPPRFCLPPAVRSPPRLSVFAVAGRGAAPGQAMRSAADALTGVPALGPGLPALAWAPDARRGARQGVASCRGTRRARRTARTRDATPPFCCSRIVCQAASPTIACPTRPRCARARVVECVRADVRVLSRRSRVALPVVCSVNLLAGHDRPPLPVGRCSYRRPMGLADGRTQSEGKADGQASERVCNKQKPRVTCLRWCLWGVAAVAAVPRAVERRWRTRPGDPDSAESGRLVQERKAGPMSLLGAMSSHCAAANNDDFGSPDFRAQG